MTAAPRWTSYVPLGDLTPAVRNPKKHELERIMVSIQEHGFLDTPVCDERTARIVGGHGRREALIELHSRGARLPEGLLLDEDGGWLVPVQRGWSSRSDQEAEALIINLNRLTEAGGWNKRVLAEMLEDLATTAPDQFDSLAFSDEEMESLLAAAPPEALGEEDQGGLGSDSWADDEAAGGRGISCPSCGHHFDPGSTRH